MKTAFLLLKAFQYIGDFLIESSVWVIACILALAMWNCLILTSNLDAPGLISLALFLFQIYWLDRSRPHQEDNVNRAQRPSPSLFILKYRLIYYYLIGAAIIIQLLLFIKYPRLLIAYVLALLATVFYALPIPAIGKRIKEIPYAKNFYAPAVATFCIFIFPQHLLFKQNTCLVMLINFFLLAANSALFDMKDIQGDRLAGLKLLSTSAEPSTVFMTLIIFNFLCTISALLFLPQAINASIAAAFAAQGMVTCCLAWHFSRRVLMFFGDGILFVPILVYLMGSE